MGALRILALSLAAFSTSLGLAQTVSVIQPVTVIQPVAGWSSPILLGYVQPTATILTAPLVMPVNQAYVAYPGMMVATGVPLNVLPGVNCAPGALMPPVASPGMPDYLKKYNQGIPGFNGGPPTKFNHLPYCNILGAAGHVPGTPYQFPILKTLPQNNGGDGNGRGSNPMSQLANALGGMGKAMNTQGSPYRGPGSGDNQGGYYNSGPDTLCTGTTSHQTKPDPAFGGISRCDFIYNILMGKDGDPSSCTASNMEKIGMLPSIRGMDEFCPEFRYIQRDPQKRALFMMNFVAAIIKTESGWNNNSTGDNGTSKGLLQLTVATDQKHNCACNSFTNELDEKQNLRCGIQMITRFMAEDAAVGDGSGRSSRGIARSFGPFRDGRKERADLIRRISDWCRKSIPKPSPDAPTVTS
ncbi:MAG: transglycosylase SLT domain-containing protein [Bdellovibrionales bacterium]